MSAIEVDAYIAQARPAHRPALRQLRRAILSACPEAEQVIRRRVPAFRLGGRPLVSIGDAEKHVALYVMQGDVLGLLTKELAGQNTSRTVVRFDPSVSMPTRLVTRIVAARAAEIAVGDATVAGARPTSRGRPPERRET